jgi:hypothetical protein
VCFGSRDAAKRRREVIALDGEEVVRPILAVQRTERYDDGLADAQIWLCGANTAQRLDDVLHVANPLLPHLLAVHPLLLQKDEGPHSEPLAALLVRSAYGVSAGAGSSMKVARLMVIALSFATITPESLQDSPRHSTSPLRTYLLGARKFLMMYWSHST